MEDPVADSQERTWAMLCHLAAFGGFVAPLGNIFAPLVVWLVKKDAYPLVDDQGKESVNFQISISLYVLVSAIFSIVLIGLPFLIAALVFGIVGAIVGAVRANEGERYRYPLTIRFLR